MIRALVDAYAEKHAIAVSDNLRLPSCGNHVWIA
jgi:hypothetical protein